MVPVYCTGLYHVLDMVSVALPWREFISNVKVYSIEA